MFSLILSFSSGQIDGQEITAAPVLLPKPRIPMPRRSPPPPMRRPMGQRWGRSPPRYSELSLPSSFVSMLCCFVLDKYKCDMSTFKLYHVDTVVVHLHHPVDALPLHDDDRARDPGHLLGEGDTVVPAQAALVNVTFSYRDFSTFL